MDLIKENYAHLSQEAQESFAKGYQLATDGLEELEKEYNSVVELLTNTIADRNRYREAFESQIIEIAQQDSDIAALQSQCTEKEKECEELKATIATQAKTIRMILNPNDTIEELKAENERLQEQYSIMDGRRERAIKSLEESEKQFGEQQQEIEKLNGLLESYYIAYECQKHLRLDIKLTDIELEEMWNNFKSENNL